MKKFLKFFAAIFVFSLLLAVKTYAADLGYVKETDIVAFIDYSPVKSFNYNNKTFVIAENLEKYGFDVVWSEENRELYITRAEKSFTPYVADFINEKKEKVTFKNLFKVYPTDIKTYINGNLAESFNIYGTTVVSADAVGEYGGGFCVYDDASRRLDIHITEKEIENCVQKKDGDGVNEIGFFEDGILSYGVREVFSESKYGTSKVRTIGNFKEGKTVKITESYIDSYIAKYEYDGVENYSADIRSEDESNPSYRYNFAQNGCVFVEADGRFKYGMRVRYALFDDGSAVRYLPKTGQIYLISEKENDPYYGAAAVYDDDGTEIYNCETYPRSFKGMIFKDGYPVYDGEIYFERFDVEGKYYGTQNIVALYAPGYTDEDGVIYYYSNYPESNMGYDSVLYRGNVVNGVMHGNGIMYYVDYGAESFAAGREIKIYREGREPGVMYAESESVMYIGSFKDGRADGFGKMYADGALKCEGMWKNGEKNGFVTEYEAYSDEIYLKFEGNYINGMRNGEGVEYAPKGNPLFEGMYKCFVGTFENGERKNGKVYAIKYNAEKNCHDVYLQD